MTRAIKAVEAEILDHGIEHSQYFQGCGTTGTKFDECITGIGVSAISALDDALEQIAMAGIEFPKSVEEEALSNVAFGEETVPEGEEHDELYYHVSIRLKFDACNCRECVTTRYETIGETRGVS